MSEDKRKPYFDEAKRIEENADLSKRRHYNATDYWSSVHYWLGIPSTISATVAGISALGENSVIVLVASVLAAILTSLMTFLNSSGRSEKHRSFGGRYDALMTLARQFYQVDFVDGDDISGIKKKLTELTKTQTDLNSDAPQTPKHCFTKALDDIEKGRSEFKVDKEK